jgi:hypothetical protein
MFHMHSAMLKKSGQVGDSRVWLEIKYDGSAL